MLKIVSNSTPIIHLAKMNHLWLLKDYFHNIIIPEMVYQECIVEGYQRDEIQLIKQADFLNIVAVKNTNMVKLLKADLDAGEAEAIALAKEINSDWILLDDSDARVKARLLELKITGTAGILLRARLDHKIPSLKNALENLKKTGFRICETLVSRLLKEAQESITT